MSCSCFDSSAAEGVQGSAGEERWRHAWLTPCGRSVCEILSGIGQLENCRSVMLSGDCLPTSPSKKQHVQGHFWQKKVFKIPQRCAESSSEMHHAQFPGVFCCRPTCCTPTSATIDLGSVLPPPFPPRILQSGTFWGPPRLYSIICLFRCP